MKITLGANTLPVRFASKAPKPEHSTWPFPPHSIMAALEQQPPSPSRNIKMGLTLAATLALEVAICVGAVLGCAKYFGWEKPVAQPDVKPAAVQPATSPQAK